MSGQVQTTERDTDAIVAEVTGADTAAITSAAATPAVTPGGNRRGVFGVLSGGAPHWVGDGFHVTNIFPSGNDLGDRMSPFFLMDYNAPRQFGPTDRPRGVGPHPHRGFETVTMAFDGYVAHHDSFGGGGVIGPGDVQWMTAASGILHKEYHEENWAKVGGTFHMMQLWVNLPKAHKMDQPRYQALAAESMGKVRLLGDAGTVNVVAGEYLGVRGPAKTFSPINLWEIKLNAGGLMDMSFPANNNVGLVVLDGEVDANGTGASSSQMILFENSGEEITVRAPSGAHLLLLEGEPLNEPVFAYGPFVMNTREEIIQAAEDFNAGKFGYLD